MKPNCLLCQSENTAHWLDSLDHVTGQTFGLHKCADCGFVFTWPQPADLDPYYAPFYRQYSAGPAGILRKLQQHRTRAWTRPFAKPGRCLEVGCGNGWALAAMRDQGWQVVGIERTTESARPAAQQLRLPMLVGPLDAIRSDAAFDLIVLRQVLEHMPDPLSTLCHCARLLRPGGRLIVAVPNLASWQFAFAGGDWIHLDLPRHLAHFTPATLRAALERAGLQLSRLYFVSWEYDPFGWVEAVLNKLGFPMNTLLRLIQHDPHLPLRPSRRISAVLLGGLLLPPAIVLALTSWLAKRGACMEGHAYRPA